MNRTAIYARISQDPHGTELGVTRQLEDCREFCQNNGWPVVEEYVDNDISAYSGKRRPDYDRMLDDIRAGNVDRVVAYHTDRLHRRLRELVEYCDVILEANVSTHTIKAGDIDLETPSGIMMAQIKGAVDEAYVSESRQKNLRARQQIAKNGGRHRAGRVYGWNDDLKTVNPAEAQVINEIADKIIAGQSQVSIASWLNECGVTTIKGKRWTGIGVRKAALRPSNAAIRSHLDQEYPGNWEPIFSPAKLEEVREAVKVRDAIGYKRGTRRVHLLTGFAFCGNCGAKLGIGRGHSNGAAAYRCNSRLSHDPLQHGCGKVNRNAAPVEHLVAACILERLNSDAMVVTINQAHDDRAIMKDLLAQQRAQQAKLDQLSEEYATTDLWTPAEFAKVKSAANEHLAAIIKKVAALSYKHTLTKVDLTRNLTDVWAEASLDWKRGIIEMLIERIYIDKDDPHSSREYYEEWYFKTRLIRIDWRV